MSIVHMTAVSRADFSRTTLPPRARLAAKAVMKVFADHANESNMSWPHVDTIALEAGCGPSTVSAATAACVEANLLRKRKTATGNKYVINMALLKQLEVPRKNRRNPDFPEFDDRDLHESPPEPETPGQDPFSEEPKTPPDQRFSDHPKTVTGSSEDGSPNTREPFSGDPMQNHQLPTNEPTPNRHGAASEPEPALFAVQGGRSDAGASKPKARRATRIPEDFAPTPDLLVWASQHAPGVNHDLETQKFKLYWESKSGQGATKLDWAKTWKNWMLTAYGRGGPPGQLRNASGWGPYYRNPEDQSGYHQPL
ncbi:helix-turn-helix domain-containing protein [Amycolatopsis thermophila]|uniref:Helix-turn-helix domain-containing protein n=1 Tax=Amycolatopsis thermophila TaxID=206084 RepID=A0ABU0EP79_9PSEU|nr:helix-turn-helix domain-containing protein [Amycolatopsis thermophila]MDQ0376612.1 hypothetical protein [Amycolatopsis thermophila]